MEFLKNLVFIKVLKNFIVQKYKKKITIRFDLLANDLQQLAILIEV